MSVYFIRAGGEGPIKIGSAAIVRERLMSLQIGCPYLLAVMATIDRAGDETEKNLHKRFAAGRIRGEWFDADTPGLLELIADILRDDIPEYVQEWVDEETRMPVRQNPWCEHKRHRMMRPRYDQRPVYWCVDCTSYFRIDEEGEPAFIRLSELV